MICLHIIYNNGLEDKIQNVYNVIKMDEDTLIITARKRTTSKKLKDIKLISIYDNDIYRVY